MSELLSLNTIKNCFDLIVNQNNNTVLLLNNFLKTILDSSKNQSAKICEYYLEFTKEAILLFLNKQSNDELYCILCFIENFFYIHFPSYVIDTQQEIHQNQESNIVINILETDKNFRLSLSILKFIQYLFKSCSLINFNFTPLLNVINKSKEYSEIIKNYKYDFTIISQNYQNDEMYIHPDRPPLHLLESNTVLCEFFYLKQLKNNEIYNLLSKTLNRHINVLNIISKLFSSSSLNLFNDIEQNSNYLNFHIHRFLRLNIQLTTLINEIAFINFSETILEIKINKSDIRTLIESFIDYLPYSKPNLIPRCLECKNCKNCNQIGVSNNFIDFKLLLREMLKLENDYNNL